MQDSKDQASTLRQMAEGAARKSESRQGACQPERVIAVTSGKGGVGKTNIVSNLAYMFSRLGKKVFVFDADMGLANIDVMLGLAPEYNLQHFFEGNKSISDILIEGPGGMKILPASSGVHELTDLSQDQKVHLLSEFESVQDDIDIFLIDTGAGISSNVLYFNMAAREKIVVATPEPTSITDAYAIMKVLSTRHDQHHFQLVVNQAHGAEEAQQLYDNLSTVADQFLNISIDYLGYIENDKHVPLAVRSQKLVTELYPRSEASLCFVKLAKSVLRNKPTELQQGNIGFFWSDFLGGTT